LAFSFTKISEFEMFGGLLLIRLREHEHCCGERSATCTVTRWRRGNSYKPNSNTSKTNQSVHPSSSSVTQLKQNNHLSNVSSVVMMQNQENWKNREAAYVGFHLIQYVTKGSVISQPVFPPFLLAVLRGWL